MRRDSGVASFGILAMALMLGGCERGDRGPDRVAVDTGTEIGQAGPGVQPGAAPPPRVEPDLRLEVDVSARELHVLRGGQRVATHPVAVGRSEWPTRPGEWTIGQVVWNPEWIPPDEEWAEDEERKAPGDPENPLGRAQLVYDPPRTIHGTNEPGSIGQAVSHGSIRVTNEVAVDLARQVMEAGGAGRDDDFYRRMRENRTERVSVNIPNPVPIRVHGGG
jgi:lipoprotein-anchoring transpeptidase ErfK/SrfK